MTKNACQKFAIKVHMFLGCLVHMPILMFTCFWNDIYVCLLRCQMVCKRNTLPHSNKHVMCLKTCLWSTNWHLRTCNILPNIANTGTHCTLYVAINTQNLIMHMSKISTSPKWWNYRKNPQGKENKPLHVPQKVEIFSRLVPAFYGMISSSELVEISSLMSMSSSLRLNLKITSEKEKPNLHHFRYM